MLRRSIEIRAALPLTSERVYQIVSAANAFSSGILLEAEGVTINGKSMLGLLAIHEGTGRRFELVVSGEDEEEAIRQIAQLFQAP